MYPVSFPSCVISTSIFCPIHLPSLITSLHLSVTDRTGEVSKMCSDEIASPLLGVYEAVYKMYQYHLYKNHCFTTPMEWNKVWILHYFVSALLFHCVDNFLILSLGCLVKRRHCGKKSTMLLAFSDSKGDRKAEE